MQQVWPLVPSGDSFALPRAAASVAASRPPSLSRPLPPAVRPERSSHTPVAPGIVAGAGAARRLSYSSHGTGDDTLDRHLVRVMRRFGSERGMDDADMEDCLVTFLEALPERRRRWKNPPAPAATTAAAAAVATVSVYGEDRRAFAAWLYTCALNHVRDYHRGLLRRRRHEVPLPEPGGPGEEARPVIDSLLRDDLTPLDVLLLQELRCRLREAVDGLKPLPREVCIGCLFEGRTVPEIAAATGQSPEAVRKRLERACVSLRKVLVRRGLTEGVLRGYLPHNAASTRPIRIAAGDTDTRFAGVG